MERGRKKRAQYIMGSPMAVYVYNSIRRTGPKLFKRKVLSLLLKIERVSASWRWFHSFLRYDSAIS